MITSRTDGPVKGVACHRGYRSSFSYSKEQGREGNVIGGEGGEGAQG